MVIVKNNRLADPGTSLGSSLSLSLSLCVCVCVCVFYPTSRLRVDRKSLLKWSTVDLNTKFSFT